MGRRRGARAIGWICAIAIAGVAAAATLAVTERNPVPRHPAARAAAVPADGIIVRLRAVPAANARPAAERLAVIAARSGLRFERTRAITAELQVVHPPAAADRALLEAQLARLRADPEVEYAVPNERRFVHAGPVPMDTLFTPAQWYLMPASAVTPSATDMQTAWETTTGAAGLVIADIDTGIRAEHPDLAGRLLPGYCFISDPFIANGGNCPGADDADPGDWVAQADLAVAECSNAAVTQTSWSSWHGTRVAGILAAVANNHMGIAGATWSGDVLPVRALGKCGGLDSDIIAGMLWAAGLTVNGAPVNPHPARIINLSLGGSGSCPASYQDAVDRITALGIAIVASAGNEGGPVDAPANCSGVIAVAGLRHAGTKVGYSNVGPGIAVAAPAGNCVNDLNADPQAQCIYPVTTTTNLGIEAPGASDYTGGYFCDPGSGSFPGCQIGTKEYRTANLGTSFAAPQVAAIVALAQTVNPKLNTCQLGARIRASAVPFPQSSATTSTFCHVPTGTSDVQAAECICTNDGRTCGAGMASASGAVAAALRPIAAIAVPQAVTPGQAVVLAGGGSAAIAGHRITQYAWKQTGGETVTLSNAGSATASATAPACGFATLALTVTDDAGRTDTAEVVLSPASATTSAPAAAGDTGCSATAPAVEVAVCPASGSLQAGSTAHPFAASLAYTADTAVTWTVDGVAGGNATVGTISTTGLYTPPASVPAGGSVTIGAVSAADSSATGSATVTITSPPGTGGGGGGGVDLVTLLAGSAALAARRRRRRHR